jgi:hypothetical protein
VIPRGVRLGRNVKVASDVRSSDFTGRIVRSGESVDRKRTTRAHRATGTSSEPVKEAIAAAGNVVTVPAAVGRGKKIVDAG